MPSIQLEKREPTVGEVLSDALNHATVVSNYTNIHNGHHVNRTWELYPKNHIWHLYFYESGAVVLDVGDIGKEKDFAFSAYAMGSIELWTGVIEDTLREHGFLGKLQALKVVGTYTEIS